MTFALNVNNMNQMMNGQVHGFNVTIDSGIRRIGDWGLGREYVEIKKKIVTWF
jgi:hypothetical protein